MMNKVIHFLYSGVIKRFFNHFELRYFINSLGHCDKTAMLITPNVCTCPQKLFFYEKTSVLSGAVFIINPLSDNGKFVMKKNSGSAENLTIITGNHQRKKQLWFKQSIKGHLLDEDKDVVIEEDVWLGANVTILSGVTIGRGATVGAGSVCVKSIPPYSVVMGNPAKVVGFNFSPEEVIEHEKALYSEEERIPLETLEKNYKKYFLDRVSEIKSFTKI